MVANVERIFQFQQLFPDVLHIAYPLNQREDLIKVNLPHE